MKRLLTVTVLAMVLVALVAVVGCSTSTPYTTPATTPPASSDASGAGAPAGAAGAAAVSIVNMAFAPEQLTIKVGDTVTWTNNDSVPHTATGADFDSGPLQQGQTFSHTFDKAGTFDYKCTIHPQMLARVTVQ